MWRLKTIILGSTCLYSVCCFADAVSQPVSQISPAAPAVSEPGRMPVYYYYCRSAGNYYPAAAECPEGWVLAPAGPVFIQTSRPIQNPNSPWVETAVGIEPIQAFKLQPNALSLELFGGAPPYTLNYDREVTEHLTLGIGISSWRAAAPWSNYAATITVLPLYLNYYFTQSSSRGYLTAGADIIRVSQTGASDDTFQNNGTAAVFGGGYEFRAPSGFLLRLGASLIAGRSVFLNPTFNLGLAF